MRPRVPLPLPIASTPIPATRATTPQSNKFTIRRNITPSLGLMICPSELSAPRCSASSLATVCNAIPQKRQNPCSVAFSFEQLGQYISWSLSTQYSHSNARYPQHFRLTLYYATTFIVSDRGRALSCVSEISPPKPE